MLVVRVGELIPVDSKFPLDNYHRIVDAPGDNERQLHEKAFARDVRNHIDAIASKYIRPQDGTYDFAFMYVPVEAVYYEIACRETGDLLAVCARQAGVPGLAIDLHRAPPGDRVRPARDADRASTPTK